MKKIAAILFSMHALLAFTMEKNELAYEDRTGNTKDQNWELLSPSDMNFVTGILLNVTEQLGTHFKGKNPAVTDIMVIKTDGWTINGLKIQGSSGHGCAVSPQPFSVEIKARVKDRRTVYDVTFNDKGEDLKN